MNIFNKKKRKNKDRQFLKLYDPKEIYLLTTEIISNCDDGSGAGPRCVTQKYLATKKDGKFYEFFSKVEIKSKDTSVPGFSFREFNVPMIEKVEFLKDYANDPNTLLTEEQLFYFITKVNADMRVLEYCEKVEEEAD